MFPEPFREKLGKDKYARWATDLTEDHLEALLWAVGEYGDRSREILKVLQEHAPKDHRSYARAVLALEILADFSHGNPIDLELLWARVHQALDTKRKAQDSK